MIREKIKEIGYNVKKFKLSASKRETSCAVRYKNLHINFHYIGEDDFRCEGFFLKRFLFLRKLFNTKKNVVSHLIINKEEEIHICKKFKDRVEKHINAKKIKKIEKLRKREQNTLVKSVELKSEELLNSINFKEK